MPISQFALRVAPHLRVDDARSPTPRQCPAHGCHVGTEPPGHYENKGAKRRFIGDVALPPPAARWEARRSQE